MSPIPSLLLVLLAVAASSAAGVAGNKLKHIHLYMHETFSGANATEGVLLPSAFGANATFGSVGVFDDELRTGRSRDSPLVARYQGIIVATGLAEGPASQGHLTIASILFVAGEYAGSALSLEGPFVGFKGTLERSIVGGSGKFRMARGYYLLKLLNLTSPLTAVSEVDFYVLTCDPSYMVWKRFTKEVQGEWREKLTFRTVPVDTPIYKGNHKMQKWIFGATSTTIIRIWSAWLVHMSNQTVDFAPKGLDKVFLDIPDENFMGFLPSFHVLVLSSGHWFAKRSAYILNGNVIGGQLWRPHEVGQMQMNNIDGFGVSIETCLTAIATNPNFKGIAILRTYSPDHYEGGAWNTNGSCTGKVKPVDEVVRNPFIETMYAKRITGFRKAIKNSGKHGSKLKLMDITKAFALRLDGHPGPYRSDDPNKKTHRGPDGKPPPQDCLHWCMPGPIDTWNEMLVETIRRELTR